MRPNGIHIHNGLLLVCCNGDNSVKSVDLKTKQVKIIARLGQGILDGIKTDSSGNILVSLNAGKLSRISPAGQVQKLLDNSPLEINCADFEFVPGKNILIVPTFYDNRVIMYRFTK